MTSKALKVVGTDGREISKVNLPSQFNEEIRQDLVERAVFAIQSHKRQPYGASPEAGKRHSSKLSRRRRNYKGSYGLGISRVPRKTHTRRGTRMHWVGALSPSTVGGRRAHPPKAEKKWSLKINVTERKKAIRTALAAVMNKELVIKRGHKAPESYPFVLDDSFESLSKTKDIMESFIKLDLASELERASVKIIRPTKGKMRGRKHKRKIGPLIVISKSCNLYNAAKNIPGVDLVTVEHINAELLAPGTQIGRLTLFTKSALEKMGKENLFI